jgi:sulfate transport system ATP-binding protein
MRFLGAVNVLRGRVEGGRAAVGDLSFSAPVLSDGAKASVYVRPHELEVSLKGAPGRFAARVERVVVLGSAVRLELDAPLYGERLEAELDLALSQALALEPGVQVFLTPRRVRVFPGGGDEGDSLTSSQL